MPTLGASPRGVPRRTFAHRLKRREPLTVEETDRAIRLARVAELAERVFGDKGKANRWLREPNLARRRRSPWPNIPPSPFSKHSFILMSIRTTFPRTINCSRWRLRTVLRSRNSPRLRSLLSLPTGATARTTRARSHVHGLRSDAPRCCECHRQSYRTRSITCSTRCISRRRESPSLRGKGWSSTSAVRH